MQAVSYHDFHQNLNAWMQKVVQDAEPLLVTAEATADAVVVMSKRDYDAMQETMVLLRNAELMARIHRGDKQIAASKRAEREWSQTIDND